MDEKTDQTLTLKGVSGLLKMAGNTNICSWGTLNLVI